MGVCGPPRLVRAGRGTRLRPLAERLRSLLSGLPQAKLPRLVLRGYRGELRYEAFFPVAAALMEGGFIGVIAAKTFEVHPAVLALISAAPMFGNLSSFAWARLARGRRKVPLLIGLQSLFLLCVLAVAFVPLGPLGVWLLTGSMIVSRLVLSGIITIRSLVWTLNYPREARGRFTSRLAALATLTISLTSLAGSFLLDENPEAFRILYALAALVGVAGVVAFARVPVLRERAHLVLEKHSPEPRSGVRGQGIVSLLRDDPLYARYQTWQFLLGTGNMMVEAPLTYLVSRQLDASYAVSISITLVIPLLLTLLTLPLWASYIDRVHVCEFRAWHSWLFAFSQALMWYGALSGSLAWLSVSRAILGVARGGGMLAWQLGHNDFADRARAGPYMGIHVTLTGVRGAFAPFLGMWLYVGSSVGTGFASEFGDLAPAFPGLGANLMLLSTGLSALAAVGFGTLHRRIRRIIS